jgi:hypothetical protein
MKIKKTLQSKEAYEILDNSNCAGSTWTSGGCAILARALNKISKYKRFSFQHFLAHTCKVVFIISLRYSSEE